VSDLNVLDETRLQSAAVVYRERCELLIERAYQQSFNVKQAFLAWLQPQLDASGDQLLVLLHDDPLYTVARYLGIPKQHIPVEITARAHALARKHHW
jgi:hypothetical protein